MAPVYANDLQRQAVISRDHELCRISDQKPGVLEEPAAERAELLEKERAELEERAYRLAQEIEELGGEKPSRIAQQRGHLKP
jgi:hypothetical protein